jgi:hypothetical protein
MPQRLQNKRSSIKGRRPSNQYLEPGELALNTNQEDPGLFFETNTGAIAKAGPTSIGLNPPESEVGYGPGETWLDSGNGTLKVWVPALEKWVAIQSPPYGGSQTFLYVGSEFSEASDDLSNDGVARPFSTLNRACLEVARRSILAGRSDEAFNARFTIMLLPGRNTVYNEPGLSLSRFEQEVPIFLKNQTLTQDILRCFNSENGGLLVPRGTSIIGLDLRKTVLVPTYVPRWEKVLCDDDPSLVDPRTSLLKWTGNCYFSLFTFRDKVGDVSVKGIGGEVDEPAILSSLRPHGFRTLISDSASPDDVVLADRVALTYPSEISQEFEGRPVLPAGEFFADPIDTFRFRLRKVSDGSVVLRQDLPQTGVPGTSPAKFATITYRRRTHHRLSALGFATSRELNEYYVKTQRAFANLTFSGTINNAEVAQGETTIVAPTPDTPDIRISTSQNGSPYLLNLSIRSDYGLCGLHADGSRVEGFRSALCFGFTGVSLQSDPDVYEVYSVKEWIPLKQAYVNSLNAGALEPVSISSISDEDTIEYLLTSIKIEDIRYYLRDCSDIPGAADLSSGLPSEISDTRHYLVKATNRGYVQTVASFAIGVAINYWAVSGSSLSVTNANSNFGGISLRAEGFTGINTTGGAEQPDTGFVIQGVRRPSLVTRQMIVSGGNVKKFPLNSSIQSCQANSITFVDPIDPRSIQPYTLRNNTFIWIEDFNTGVVYSARLASTGDVFSTDRRTIFLIQGTNGIYVNNPAQGNLVSSSLGLPFLRRFVDPRAFSDRTYSLWVRNTSQDHRAPEVGSILRFAEKPQAGVSNLLVPGKQLDPGQSGGWGHLFQVIDSRTKREGNNPNQTEPLITPAEGAQDYYVTLSPVDLSRPWVRNGLIANNSVPALYPRGYHTAHLDRVFYARDNDLDTDSQGKLTPESLESVWTRSKSLEYCQSVDRTWLHSSGFDAAEDLFSQFYTGDDNFCYPRGMQFDVANSAAQFVIDVDFGGDDLGIALSDGIADPELSDPWWSASKTAMLRFLALLGYEEVVTYPLLTPRRWSSRILPVNDLPAPSGKGYALSTGTWPVEFNRPSTIRCGNHTWEWSGYLDYSKGLPKYQRSQLSLRQRLDFLGVSLWGGFISANGNTERNEFIVTGKTVAGGTGVTIFDPRVSNSPLGIQTGGA